MKPSSPPYKTKPHYANKQTKTVLILTHVIRFIKQGINMPVENAEDKIIQIYGLHFDFERMLWHYQV